MKILAFVNGNNGPCLHRCIMPLLLMKDVDVFITNNLLEEHFEGIDLFIYNRIIPEHHIAKIAELKKRIGFKIAVDIDDYWYLDEHHVLYDYYQKEEFARKQICQLIDADVVLCTHDRLAMEVKEYNDNVHVCPNAIPKAGQFKIAKKPHEFVQLFWQGSDTHAADVSLLTGAIDKLNTISGKIKMVMAGFADHNEAWASMVWNYTAGLKHQYKLIPYTHVDKYYQAYKEADICLVPLVNSKFNRHKSNLKVLEAANLSLPVVVSAVHPYLDMPLLFCHNSSDWIRHIKKLVRSAGYRNETGLKLAEYCDKHFNFNKINEERKQILTNVTSQYRVS